jgi:hypothetical protein
MKRPRTVLVLLLGLMGSSFAQVDAQADQGADQRLAKPVTAKLPMVPLPRAMKELSKAAGFTLEASPAMSRLKVTVLVKDLPVTQVMTGLASVFHGEWTRDGELYRLSVSSEWRNQESAFLLAEDKAQRKEAEAAIAPLIAATAIPYSQVLTELKKPEEPGKPNEKRALYQRVASPEMYLLGSTFRKLNTAGWNAFWEGRPLSVTDMLAPEEVPATQPPQGQETRGQELGQRNGRAARRAAIVARMIRATASYDPLNGSLSLNGVGGSNGGGGKLIEHPYPTGELAALPFGKEVLAWQQSGESTPALDKSVSSPVPKSQYYLGRYSMADALVWLHEASGVPIVADAFRTPVTIPGGGGSVASRLNALRQANSAFLRIDHGMVMMRHGGFWRLKAVEAPEETFARIEGSKSVSLDDYADLAARLTDLQYLPFRANAALLKVDPEPIRIGLPALRFYASLGSADRALAKASKPIPFSKLGGASRQLFVTALESPLGQAAGRPLNLQDPQIAGALGFLMRSTTGERLAGDSNSLRREVTGATEMLFGTAPGQGIRYVVPVG